MGNSVELVSGFWLPSEFLTDDDFVMKNNNSSTEFPTNENAENLWVMSTSPQSTLTNMGSPNGVPRTTSFGRNYDGVSRVGMLKLSNGDGVRFGVGPNKNTRFMGPHTCFFQQPKNPTLHQQQTDSGVTYGQMQMYGNWGEMGQGAWTMKQNPTRNGGVGVKRGTGVFLPPACRYESNNNLESCMSQPDRIAAHASNNSIDNISGFSRSHSLSQPMFNRGFIQDYDLLMARRHALMLRQQRSLLLAKRSSMISRETCLPHEWTY